MQRGGVKWHNGGIMWQYRKRPAKIIVENVGVKINGSKAGIGSLASISLLICRQQYGSNIGISVMASQPQPASEKHQRT
jgi:hypothetical protein